ncbi:MAG: bifunctional adenosylcobinamide kinase/adenosylcobinamide-phosphate guanylyltransferase [Gallintestinimicrobium sp.]
MEVGENRIYIATMQPMDNECLARIEKHRGMRAQKNFQTVECYTGLKQVRVPKDSVVLLECMSNLTANEIYAPEGVGRRSVQRRNSGRRKALETVQASDHCQQRSVRGDKL